MIKALFRKQFAELISQFFRKKRRDGNPPNRRGLIVFLLVFAFVYLSIGVAIYSFSQAILKEITGGDYTAFYLLIGIFATVAGLLGSVFNAYTTVFEAKDNEMLLSMPIPPRNILFVRIAALTLLTLLYESSVTIPAFIAFVRFASPSPLGAVNAFFSIIPLTLLVVALTLVLAFVVAVISRKVKHKNAITLIVSLIMILLFYFFYFRAQTIALQLISQPEIPKGIKYGLFFYYAMGRASMGKATGAAIIYGTAIGAFALAYFVMSKSFLRFTTAKKSAAVKGKAGKVKAGSLRLALFRREAKLFFSSPNYVLNCAFGTIMLAVIAVFAMCSPSSLHTLADTLRAYLPRSSGCAVGALLVMVVTGMNDITSASVSMEGQKLSVIRSLPVPATEIFRAKISLHLVVVLPFTILAAIPFSVIFGSGDVLGAIFLPLSAMGYGLFTACFGLCMNVSHPVLDWKDQTMAVKTGISVFLSVFGSMILVTALAALWFVLSALLSDGVILLILTLLFLGASAIMIYWLSTAGKKKFDALE